MAVLNYLQLVNKVLAKLREDEVASVDDTAYSRLIGTFVNDAKDEVEAAWNWASLRQTINITALAGTRNYGLSITTAAQLIRVPGCPRLPMAFAITSDSPVHNHLQMQQHPLDYIIREQIISNFQLTDTNPLDFGLEGVNGEWTVQFISEPTDTTNGAGWRFFFKVPQDELDEDGDGMLVPWRPVIALATMYALNERGEEIGEPGNIAEQKYRQTLSAAISLEALENDHQIIVTPE
jgi:hypothetical protein